LRFDVATVTGNVSTQQAHAGLSPEPAITPEGRKKYSRLQQMGNFQNTWSTAVNMDGMYIPHSVSESTICDIITVD